VRLDWLPYDLDLADFMGSARVDDSGRVLEAQRTPHQWRRVKYSYMDCRRQARKRGLVILGTRKIWDSSIAAIGMLWAKCQGAAAFRAYHDRVFERFWRRELNIEDAEVVAALGSFVDRAAAQDLFSGVVVLAKDGKPLLQRAVGVADPAHKQPNKFDTKFNLGSMNKMFTQVAIAQLAQAGRRRRSQDEGSTRRHPPSRYGAYSMQ